MAGKGYDAERDHEYAQVVQGTRKMVPVHASIRSKIRLPRKCQRMQPTKSNAIAYHHGMKVETAHLAGKLTIGSHMLARGTS